MMKKNLPLIIINLLIVLVFLLHIKFPVKFIERMENLSYDLRLNLTMPRTPDNRVVIVDIDEKSLAKVGRWPWSRDKLALLMDNLFDHYHTAVVGFDVVFAEKDESSGIKVLEQLGRQTLKNDKMYQQTLPGLRTQLDYDHLFAAKIKSRNVVLGYSFSNDSERIAGQLPAPVFTAETMKAGNTDFERKAGYAANLPILQKSAHSAGHFNPFMDQDGIVRRVPILQEYKGAYYEALSVAMVRSFLGDPPLVADIGVGMRGYSRLEGLSITDFKIPVDEKATALIPYRGKWGSFKYLPAVDVLQKKIKKDELEGAIVLIGTSAAGLLDLRSTPVAEIYPGVEIHANMITGILDQNIKYIPAYVVAIEIFILCMTGLLLALLLPSLNPLKSTILSAVMLLLIIVVNGWAWHANMVFPLASAGLMIPLLFVVSMSYGFFTETRTKQHLTGLFGQYVPPELVDKMADNPAKYTMDGKSEELTVLFSDVRGFTTISESLAPKELTHLMNEYLSAMTKVIRSEYQGTLDKYIGDAIMAFWGAPVAQPDHARRSVLAALQMQKMLAQMRPYFLEKYKKEIKIGIGLSTGMMTVGDMGSEIRKAYTVMGDAVNLGARLEGITKQYGVGILVAENTRNAVPDIIFKELDRVTVKGKDKPVAIYEPIGPAMEVTAAEQEELTAFAEVLVLYRAMSWVEAEVKLLELQKAYPEKYLYNLYLERVSYFQKEPPAPDWDGVFRFTTK